MADDYEPSRAMRTARYGWTEPGVGSNVLDVNGVGADENGNITLTATNITPAGDAEKNETLQLANTLRKGKWSNIINGGTFG